MLVPQMHVNEKEPLSISFRIFETEQFQKDLERIAKSGQEKITIK